MPDNLSEFLTEDGLKLILEEVRSMVTRETSKIAGFSIVELNNISELPNIGSDNTLYIVRAIDGNVLYRWVKDELKYIIIGSNYQNINIINGGNANA